ncbi:MAG: hypothetical protein DMF56_24535 [Acidobacteria bacterium]|nr:MAG: hypothetical protein DMF56_24535 [Acidobacteriota bacterium]
MLDQLTIETFEPLVGTTFWLHTQDETGRRKIQLRLERAAKVMESEAAHLPRNPFSLYFLGPGSIYLEQKIYHLTQEDAFPEGLDIFLVPISKEANGYQYEAVFV